MPSVPNKLAKLLLLVAWIAAIGLVAVSRQDILDWWLLRSYQAPAAVAQLAAQDSMTDYGRKIFYVNHPSITSKNNFGKYCRNDGGELTIVLGCYHSGQSGIYLLGIDDKRLNGVEQVTAAHEMLHAGYERLNSSERHKVDKMLEDYYSHQLHDPRIIKTIAAYKKSEPKDVINEMHSIFGTEIANLPTPLEQYYQRYFTSRSQVATLAANYQSEFTSRQNVIARYDTQLANLKAQITKLETDLKFKEKQITSQQKALARQRSSGSITAYNTGVPAYNALIDSYNIEVTRIKSLIVQYNNLVATRNSVALEEDQLVKELTSQAQPINN